MVSLLAFWDLHEETVRGRFRNRSRQGLGLPVWMNHLAFSAPDGAKFYGRILAR